MTQEIVIKGMTWSDPRGFDPLVAASAAFAKSRHGVHIEWDKRSLQGFESTPVDALAQTYDKFFRMLDNPYK